MKIVIRLTILFAVLGLAVGCGETFKDSPVGDRENSPAVIIQMPDQYSNQATKCISDVMPGYRIFVSSNDQASRPVLVRDPQCGEAAPGTELDGNR
jgi:hypothetical protein